MLYQNKKKGNDLQFTDEEDRLVIKRTTRPSAELVDLLSSGIGDGAMLGRERGRRVGIIPNAVL
jgi:hypothetical protein